MCVSVAVLTRDENDLLSLLQRCNVVRTTIFAPDSLTPHCLDSFDCACILGGTQEEPLVLPAECRQIVEDFIASGKKVLFEYTLSFCQNYCKPPESTRFLRLVCADPMSAGLEEGTLLDDQCNLRVAPYYHSHLARPILIYKKGLSEHACQKLSNEDLSDFQQYGLWFETPNVAVSSFCLANFVRARLAPVKAWQQVIHSLLNWLLGIHLPLEGKFVSYYETNRAASLDDAAERGIRWFTQADILLEDGRKGVREGLATEILPDGRQKKASPIRTDCAGETALAYFFHALATGDKNSLKRSSALESFVYDRMQIKSGRYAGMLRWTDVAWEVCYQDDMARAMFVTLFKALYHCDRTYLPQCRQALEFLMNTTGPDGLRPARTDNLNMSASEFQALQTTPANFPCAHYNAFYLACLLLYGKLEHDSRCLEIGIKGIHSIMKVYPKTIREQSETEELCRLVLPLSWLYWATGSKEDKALLYKVVEDLQKLHHPSGAYLEWDSDYSAACSKQEDGECSLLSRNGDPVADLLYSNNWLPLGLMQAYFVTGDELFWNLFREHADFLIRAQIYSKDPHIDGAWARGFDVNLMEVYGLPNDVGWGPWAIESGWTVAEITAGLYSGILKDSLMRWYQ